MIDTLLDSLGVSGDTWILPEMDSNLDGISLDASVSISDSVCDTDLHQFLFSGRLLDNEQILPNSDGNMIQLYDTVLDSVERLPFSECLTESLNISDEYRNSFDSHHSDLSFTGNLGNMYDKNTIDFLDECHRYNIDLPLSVDHSNLKSESIVDRSYDGGLMSIDKSIIEHTLKDYHDKGALSDCGYNKLSSMLNKC